ncbi:hypothetical protein M413DRAFT_29367 [Hebeloma cylindrosporum]|uniref:Uncharacterized protein n=1 Tax=Hebeloma cylindrosporum TaxID=76867 RepID=A0A0C3BRA1_HEBCY|nr:hypothetical protein M413DRAFT_29367 [Hebeloma cylindrosporum h7]
MPESQRDLKIVPNNDDWPTTNELKAANHAIRNQGGVVLPYNTGATVAIAHAKARQNVQRQVEVQLEYMVGTVARTQDTLEKWLKEWDM